MKDKQSVELYIRQAATTRKLLARTNSHGANSGRIAEIDRKIKKARSLLKRLG